MRLDELLNNSLEIHYEEFMGDSFSASFVAPNGQDYQVALLEHDMAPDEMYVQLLDFVDEDDLESGMFAEFALASDDSQGITGTGNAFQVFAAVVEALIRMIKEANCSFIYFQGAEPSRRKLYNRLAPRIANLLGWQTISNEGFYLIYSPQIRI